MKIVTHRRGASTVAALVLAGLAACAPVRTTAGTAPSPTGYPDSAAVAPLYLRAASPAAPIGRSAPERRRLAGRGAEFMRGVSHVPGALPVRLVGRRRAACGGWRLRCVCDAVGAGLAPGRELDVPAASGRSGGCCAAACGGSRQLRQHGGGGVD
jgi:hypothetical protein